MNVLMLSPAYPNEMRFFTRGLAAVGANVIGIGDTPGAMLPPEMGEVLADYVHVPSLWDEPEMVATVRGLARRVRIDRIECLWEPGVSLAGALRDALGVPGMSERAALPFRDKILMKEVLDAAGIRTPRHARVGTIDALRSAAEEIGYPLIVKPIAGAGSADTYKIENAGDLERVIPLVRHVPELNVEEFITGDEYTYDTVCANGRPLYENVSNYRPPPLIGRTCEWISPQTICRRDLDDPTIRPGIEMGRRVLQALEFEAGFTHMEWFLTADGEAVFGEIGGRPPGARSVDVMNYTSDADLFVGWAEAVCHGRISQSLERKYNSAVIFKRAQGQGRIQRIEGLEGYLQRFGEHVVSVDLLPIGAPRRNWKQTLLSDGSLVLRHPDLAICHELADRFGIDVQIYAG